MPDQPKKKKRPRRFRLTRKRIKLIAIITLTFALLSGLLLHHIIWELKNSMIICMGIGGIETPCRNLHETPFVQEYGEEVSTVYWMTTTPEPQPTQSHP